MGNVRPIASIILPCYFRPKTLWWGLYSLVHQKIKYKFEIIVLNDGQPDETEEVCNYFIKEYNLDIKYKFVGERNNPKPIWRVPGAVFNIGAKMSDSYILILSSPEIFHLNENSLESLITPLLSDTKLLTIPNGKNDMSEELTKKLNDLPKDKLTYEKCKNLGFISNELNTKLPFCMGMTKQQFAEINGFDKRFFEGYCFDDNDFVDRLIKNKCTYYNTGHTVIHLFNSRKTEDRIGLENRNLLWQKNKDLYNKPVKEREPKKIVIKSNVQETIQKINKDKITEQIKKRQKNSTIISCETGDITKWHLNKIPKIAHFYWGNKKLSYIRYLTVVTFHKFNPDWEIRFYYPKYPQTGKSWTSYEHKYDMKGAGDYYDELRKLPVKLMEIDMELFNISNELSEVHKSDYLRWHLLSTVGGLWSDMDIIYTSTMNKIHLNIEVNKNIEIIVCTHQPWNHSVGFLLGSENNEYYSTLWKKALQRKYDPTNYQTVGSLLVNSVMKDMVNIKSKYPNAENISMTTVYAYNSFKIKLLYDTEDLSLLAKDTIGLHWYAGHPKGGDFISKVTHNNYKSLKNVISHIITLAMRKNSITEKKKNSLTIHSVIKNEPFIYYSIKSVYDYAEKILLYDTGSTDRFTLHDIKRLLKEDVDKKITYKQIPLEFDESQWTYEKVEEFAKKNKGKMSVGKVRQMQIDDTTTDFFMIVDGDEVHYKSTMETIVNMILPILDKNIIGVNIPLMWFYNTEQTFKVAGLENTGRIWRTSEVKMNDKSPNEYHCFKETGVPVAREDKEYLIYKDIKPYAHFETFLKPWRRKVHYKLLMEYVGSLPEVMETNSFFIERYLKEKEK